MDSLERYVADYLDLMREGRAEDALCGLIEAGAAVVPVLIDAFAREENRDIRAEIVHCIWQHRRPETIMFLAATLRDAEPGVWQEALDGLVTIGGRDAIGALEAARATVPASGAGRALTAEWLDEALEQIRERAEEENSDRG
jgi:hypothetical protein